MAASSHDGHMQMTAAVLESSASIALLIGLGVPLSIVDFREHRLPNTLVAWLSIAALVVVAIGSFLRRDPSVLLRCGMWAAAVAIVAIGLAWLSPRTLGMGDAKLLPALAALVALNSVNMGIALIAGLWVASVTGSMAAIAVRLRAGAWPTSIAYGPHLLTACALCCLLRV